MIALLTALPSIAPAEERGESINEAVEQAILYYKRDRIKRARIEFERARQLPGGAEHGLVHLYLGRIYARLGLIDRAFPAAQRAKDLTKSQPLLLKQANDFLASLNRLYAAVHFRADDVSTAPVGSILLDSKSPIINRDKRRQYQSVRERFRTSRVELPLTTYLPVGSYQANQVQFSVALGEITTVNIDLLPLATSTSPVAAKKTKKSRVWLYVGIAAGVAVAAGLGGWFLLKEDEQAATAADYPLMIQNLEAR